MVTLQKIRKNNNIVEVEYYAEDNSDDTGRIVFDLTNEKVLDIQLCNIDNESYLKTYYHKAVNAIKEISRLKELPATYVYMWY